MPLNGDSNIYEARLTENRTLAPSTFLMTVDCPEAARSAGPGQFVKLRTWPENQGPLLDRPFSVHRAAEGRLSVLYRVLGPATTLMSRAKPGQAVKISGPLGQNLAALTSPESFYLVGGGIGLAPLALARDWLGANKTFLFYGERNGAAQVDQAWLKSWAGDFAATVEDGSGYGEKGLVTAPLERALTQEPRPIFACGPTPMLAAVSELAGRYGVTPWVSVEAGMACAYGVCLSCSLPLISGGRFRVCLEGPVVDGSKVDWKRIRS